MLVSHIRKLHVPDSLPGMHNVATRATILHPYKYSAAPAQLWRFQRMRMPWPHALSTVESVTDRLFFDKWSRVLWLPVALGEWSFYPGDFVCKHVRANELWLP